MQITKPALLCIVLPFDQAWVLLKEEVYGPKEHPLGRVKFYHATDPYNARRIEALGLKPHDETLGPGWQGPAEFDKPTVAVAQNRKGAEGYGHALFGIRGTAEELGLTERYPDNPRDSEWNTYNTISPERLGRIK